MPFFRSGSSSGGGSSSNGVPALRALKTVLAAADRSCAIQVLSDSTANDPFDWPYRLAESLAAKYPAWTVQHRLWDDTNQRYAAPVTIQTGTAGERYLDGSTGTSTRRLDNSVSPHISGIIDVRVKVNLADWTPSVQCNLLGRNLGSPGRSWYLIINTGGVPVFAYSTDGSAVATMAGTSSAGVADGTTSWIRAVFNPNDGAGNRVCTFYKSADGLTWTQIGNVVTAVGAVTLFDPSSLGPTYGYEIGGTGGAANAAQKTYEVQIRNGLDGPNVVPALPDLWPPYSSVAAVSVGAPILTVVNGSKPGAAISYLGDSVRLPKMTPDLGQVLTFLSDSHNEGTASGKQWTTMFETWRTAVESRLGVPSVILTQNPETSGTTWYREHAKRRLDLLSYALQKKVDVIDTYQTFLDAGWPGDFMADPVHPNATGSDLWRDAILARFNAS